MKKHTRVLTLILAAMLILSVGCATQPEPTAPPTSPEAEEPEIEPHPMPEVDPLPDAPSPFEGYDIIVNGVPAPSGFHHTVAGEIMPTHVTLLPVLNALGTSVNISNNHVVMEGMNGEITFTVGGNDFTVAGNTITLAHASYQTDGTIYVPLTFFREVYGAANTYFEGGHVFIDTEGPQMH